MELDYFEVKAQLSAHQISAQKDFDTIEITPIRLKTTPSRVT